MAEPAEIGFEEGAEGEVDLEGALDAGDDLWGQQGVASQLEEVVVDADVRAAEELLPDLDQ